jgi:hypothetical protein
MTHQMEHQIRKTPLFDLRHKESETLNSETPMIIREMLIYNRQLVEENIMLRAEIKQLETKNHNLNIALSVEANINKDEFSDITQAPIAPYVQANPENEADSILSLTNPKVKIQKKGTQVCVDPAIATMFARQLKDSGYKLADVARGMMLTALERPRYRNMIFDRIKQSERISNTERECTSFAFTYPVDLGENFNALLRSHKIKQYEFFEQMFKEFVQSYSFRKLLPDYIHHVKHKNKI